MREILKPVSTSWCSMETCPQDPSQSPWASPTTSILMREINPDDLDAKLGIETFMVIIDTTGDSVPLNVMVQKLGYRLVPVD